MHLTSVLLTLLEFKHPIFKSGFWPNDHQLYFVLKALYGGEEIQEPTPYTTLVSNISKTLSKLAKLDKSSLTNWHKRKIRILNTSRKQGLHWIVSDIVYGQNTSITLYDPYSNTLISDKIVKALKKIKVHENLTLHISIIPLGLQDDTDTSGCGVISTFIQLVLLIKGSIDVKNISVPPGWDRLVHLLMYLQELQTATLPMEDCRSLCISDIFHQSVSSSISTIIGKIGMQIHNLQT